MFWCVWMCLDVFMREIRERRKREREIIFPELPTKSFFFFKYKMRGLKAFIAKKWPFSYRRTLKGCWPTCWHQQHWPYPSLTLDTYLKAFLKLDLVDLGVPGKIWMSSFENTKEIKNPTVRSRVIAFRSVSLLFLRFSGYLNCLTPILTHE